MKSGVSLVEITLISLIPDFLLLRSMCFPCKKMAHPSSIAGDRVGVLVTPQGQLQIFVNGKWRLDGPKNVETSGLDRCPKRPAI